MVGINILEDIFQRARKDLFYPPIRLNLADVSSVQMDFSSGKYTILVNKEIKEFYSDNAIQGLLHHELNHWVKHPYDLKTVILETSWIEEIEEDEIKASFIRNLYDDVVVTLDLVINRGLDGIIHFYSESSVSSNVDNLLRRLFEDLTGLRFGSMEIDGELIEKLEELKKIDYLDVSRVRVRRNILQFARIVKDIIEGVEGYPFPVSGVIDFPREEIKAALTDIAKEMELVEFKKVSRVVERWVGVAEGNKSDYEIEKPDINWYLSRARKYTIYINPLMRKGSLYPDEIKDFEIDDSIDTYSPVDSYGKIIPGIAKKFSFREFEGFSDEPVPDALIVIDSSGSMRNPDKEVSYAVIGAFAVARNYIENGAKVGVINFSGRNIELKPTKNAEKIYETLKIYQGLGTTLHLDDFERYLLESRIDDCILISDTGLDNLDEFLNFLPKIKMRITVIWIKSDVKDYEQFKQSYKAFKDRLPSSVTFIEVEKEEDIPGIAVGRTFSEVYSSGEVENF
jgi:hypothetical protein